MLWRRKILENHNAVSLDGPISKYIQGAYTHSIDRHFRTDPADLCTNCSSGNFSPLGNQTHHAFNIVISGGGFLVCDGAVDAIPDQENLIYDLCSFGQVHRQAECIVGTFISIGTVINNE